MGSQVIVVTGRRRPHELLLLVYGGFIGATTLARQGEGAVAVTFPRAVVAVWALGLLGAMVLGVTGSYWRGEPAVGLQIEMGAMLVGAGAALLYAFAVIAAIGGWQGWISGGLLCAWTVANLWRAAQIAADLRGIRVAGGER